MNRSFRILLVAAPLVLLLLAGSFVVLGPDMYGRLLDATELPLIMAELAEAQLEGRMLDAQCDTSLRRLEAKHQVSADLLAGRLSLLEAAAWMRELNRTAGATSLAAIRDKYSVGSEEELWCREAITWASLYLQDHPDQDPAVLLLLEAELDERLEHGTLVLPEVAK